MLLLVDLDGVVYRGREPVPGVPELLRARERDGDAVVFCTNNSRFHRDDYLSHLAEIGLPVGVDRILTSARATALALAEDRVGPAPLMVAGGAGLARELREVGFRVVAPTDRGLEAAPQAVVVGIDFRLSHERISTAAEAVRRGARFVATNRDARYPTPTRVLAGAGAVVAAIEVAAGHPPDVVVGKPEPLLFREAARVAGWPLESAVVIGDGLASDIAAARRLELRSVLMLTGVTTRKELEAVPPDLRPTAVARDAPELAAALERFAAEQHAGR